MKGTPPAFGIALLLVVVAAVTACTGDECKFNSDCPGAELCTGGECLAACKTEKDCPSGVDCLNGACSGGGGGCSSEVGAWEIPAGPGSTDGDGNCLVLCGSGRWIFEDRLCQALEQSGDTYLDYSRSGDAIVLCTGYTIPITSLTCDSLTLDFGSGNDAGIRVFTKIGTTSSLCKSATRSSSCN